MRPNYFPQQNKPASTGGPAENRSEEHTSELQSRLHLVCRLLLEKKKKTRQNPDCPGAQLTVGHSRNPALSANDPQVDPRDRRPPRRARRAAHSTHITAQARLHV